MMNVAQVNPMMGKSMIRFASSVDNKIRKEELDPEEVRKELFAIFKSRVPDIDIFYSEVSTSPDHKTLQFYLFNSDSAELALQVLRNLQDYHKIELPIEKPNGEYDAYKGYHVNIFGKRGGGYKRTPPPANKSKN